MKKIILSALCISSLSCFSQKMVSKDEYQTRKGFSIKTGDTLTIGVPSSPTGSFNYVTEVRIVGGFTPLDKASTNVKLLVTGIQSLSKSDANLVIRCVYLGKKKPVVIVYPDAAFIKEEVYLPGQ